MIFRNLFLICLVSALATLSYAREEVGDLLQCPDIIDFSEHGGQTFLSFMESTVKPVLDEKATEGYPIADGDRLVEVLDRVAGKVSWKVMKSLYGDSDSEKREALRELGDTLEGQIATLYTLPMQISDAQRVRDRYTLSTYIGLASCGGAIIKFAEDNYAYNIHYGTGVERKDERTGRSFGASRVSAANDASDAHYLRSLEEYVRNDKDNTDEFFETLLDSLINSDPRDYDKISDEGQGVLTDFLAVFAAEQDRNLMDGEVHPHWDAALLQVTLLSAFHAGQDTIKLLYENPLDGNRLIFTEVTYEQENGCDIAVSAPEIKDAGLVDYWQFSRSTNTEHCRRSGINITRKAWRTLGEEITTYMLENDPRRVENVRKWMNGYSRYKKDIFRALAGYLVNSDTPRHLGREGHYLSRNMVTLLKEVREHAPEITKMLEAKYNSTLR